MYAELHYVKLNFAYFFRCLESYFKDFGFESTLYYLNYFNVGINVHKIHLRSH